MAEQQAIFRPTDVQVGDTIGSLLMLSTAVSGKRRHWQVRCTSCGMERPIRSDHLVRYVGTECHCREIVYHGLSSVREFKIWTRMLDRCYNTKANNYRFYGAVGTRVCQRWRESYGDFIADMGEAPSKEHTLDRINSKGSYTCGSCEECNASDQPANCRWATKAIQNRNQRSNRYYTHEGKTLILKDWARLVGMGYLTLHSRLERGWSFEDAIKTPTKGA